MVIQANKFSGGSKNSKRGILNLVLEGHSDLCACIYAVAISVRYYARTLESTSIKVKQLVI